MPREYPPLFYFAYKKVAHVHDATGPCSDHPNPHRNCGIRLAQLSADASRDKGAGFTLTGDAGLSGTLSAASQTSEEAAVPETSPDTGEDNPQPPSKLSLLNVSIRVSVSSFDVVGSEAEEEFRAFDVAANFKSPWGWYSQSGWGAGLRLMTGASALNGGGDTGLVFFLLPLLALGSQDGRFTLDMGAGGALFSRRTFGTQDFGGYFQFALTVGISVPLFWRLGAGYRFMHYSDAAIYGPNHVGADLHMLELIYRF